jgi:hypothetical protein
MAQSSTGDPDADAVLGIGQAAPAAARANFVSTGDPDADAVLTSQPITEYKYATPEYFKAAKEAGFNGTRDELERQSIHDAKSEPGYTTRYFRGVGKAANELGSEIAQHPLKSIAVSPMAALEAGVQPITSTIAGASAVLHHAIDPSKPYAERREEYEKGLTSEPETNLGKKLGAFAGAVLKPVGDVMSVPGKIASFGARLFGASPDTQKSTEEQTNAVFQAGLLSAGARRTATEPETAPPGTQGNDSAGAARVAGAKVSPEGFDTEPKAEGVPKEMQSHRAAVLQRVGLDTARNSALEGNAMDAAVDANLQRYNEPAGQAAKAQFEAEKAALTKHAEGIVNDVGGVVGMDEDALHIRGQRIAKPFDKLREWFEDQRKALYKAADQRAQGKPIGQLNTVDTLLKDPDFTETLLAKDQGALLGSVQRQFKRFTELNPQGFTVDAAENFRQWLNQVWTPDNSATLGKIKGALVEDVLKSAGEDIYGPARKMVQLEAKTLDNPNGISKLFDSDPKTPINRTTPFNKIPDTLTRLSPDQFNEVLKTLKAMPPEIQQEAQIAAGEIKAHLANKLWEAGTSTQGQWNAKSVSKVLKAHASKIQSAFEDAPEALAKIEDLESAGKILKVDAFYPGASAQAANALKRGMMSTVVNKVAGPVGSVLGGMVAGPTGAAGGAAAGEAIGSRGAAKLGEAKALKTWQEGTSKLSDILKKAPPSP